MDNSTSIFVSFRTSWTLHRCPHGLERSSWDSLALTLVHCVLAVGHGTRKSHGPQESESRCPLHRKSHFLLGRRTTRGQLTSFLLPLAVQTVLSKCASRHTTDVYPVEVRRKGSGRLIGCCTCPPRLVPCCTLGRQMAPRSWGPQKNSNNNVGGRWTGRAKIKTTAGREGCTNADEPGSWSSCTSGSGRRTSRRPLPVATAPRVLCRCEQQSVDWVATVS